MPRCPLRSRLRHRKAGGSLASRSILVVEYLVENAESTLTIAIADGSQRLENPPRVCIAFQPEIGLAPERQKVGSFGPDLPQLIEDKQRFARAAGIKRCHSLVGKDSLLQLKSAFAVLRCLDRGDRSLA